MRIIEVLFYCPLEVFIARHILALRQYGIDPIILSLAETAGNARNDASVSEDNPDIGKVHFPIPSNPIYKFASLRYLVKPHTHIAGRIRDRVLSSYIESLHPDLVHFHIGNLAGYLYKIPRSLNIPYTISLRGSDIQVLPYESQERFLNTKNAIKDAAGIHTVSNALWDTTLETFGLSIDQVYHKTIYTTVPLDKPKEIKRIDKKKILVTVGRLHWTKSLSLLLIAFKKFCTVNPDSELLIIGNGELRECINYWIRYLQLQNNVILKGKMNYSEIAGIIQNADAFIQSSIAEGFSNATAEAMGLGCPVFATDVGGTNEIIEDGVNGFLLDPISPESWPQKFQLVQDEILMRSIGENARKTAELKFSKYLHANEFFDFYKTVIMRHNQ